MPIGRWLEEDRCPGPQAATHRDTPPRAKHVVEAGLLACGSAPPRRPSRHRSMPVAHSSGGSPLTVAGAAPVEVPKDPPDSLLAFDSLPNRRNHDKGD